jgi:hypothetical protein
LQAQQRSTGHARLLSENLIFYLQGRELAPRDWTVCLMRRRTQTCQ